MVNDRSRWQVTVVWRVGIEILWECLCNVVTDGRLRIFCWRPKLNRPKASNAKADSASELRLTSEMDAGT
jgi:hypothetical protein